MPALMGAPIATCGRVLGIDLGSRRIGVAISDGAQRLATGIGVITRRSEDSATHDEVVSLVGEWEAVGVVVGLPLSMSGQIGPAAAKTLGEIEVLATRLGVPVATVDERMTTITASAALRAGGRSARKQRSVVDQVAAAVLLQAWLDQQARP
ncbi:MAG: Holliday junction resolvase RuvX [Actinomycetota bacterium]|nr:Holliday junction resolvase RuvX [Actinomycetota bacterium]